MTDSDKNRAVPVSAEELDALRRDAARYRWLRDDQDTTLYAADFTQKGPDGDDLMLEGVALDSAIDAAMEESCET